MNLRSPGIAVLLMFALLPNAAVTQHTTPRGYAASVTRAKWELGTRAASGGTNAANLRAQAIAQKLKIRTARPASATGVGGAWLSLGPLPLPSDASGIGLQDYNWISGRATAIAVDPNDSTGNTVFIGGANGGVWKSTNAAALSPSPGGVIWSALTDDQPTLAIGALAVQPQASNPNPANSIVLAGTGETNSSADSYYGLGILRSTDGGQTWTLISQDVTGTHSFAGIGFSRFAFSRFDPNVVVAGAGSASEGIIEDLENPLATNRGIYFSSDAGVTWNSANVTDLGTAISPASVTSVAYNAVAAKFYAAVRYHGFYASFDGVNWLRLATQPGTGLSAATCPTQAAQPSACPFYRGEIAVVPNRAGPNSAGEMYVWYTDANDVDQGIWQSLDGGFSWTQINDGGIANCGDLLGGCGTEFASDNLTLAALPNGSATDLYAGAVNIYKCSISSLSPTCGSGGNSGFINLTHVYGCSDIAKVYPGQHAIDFSNSGASGPIYFANDGGIYRAVNGSSDLTTGTCGLSNQFDSLNATLGPLTQFTSLAASASDPNLLFGGTTENGAPATDFAQSGNNWVNVNAGSVGTTAINPSNDNEWFLSAPPNSASGVNLFRCANGVNCHTEDFASDQIADSVALGGDTGGFRLPFMLDPGNPATVIVGTCKVWRGPSTGGSFSLLSPDFENGGTGVCNGSETNMVRAIAAGGSVDSNGNSQVIYAGTNGYGPLVPATPPGGHLWITTNADAGPASWVDRTSSINPSGFPISSIAIDPSDATGQTAYVGIMGFGASQIWKTTNAGISWTDFTGNLPAAIVQAGTPLHPPVNSIVIDSSSATIYVGTDIGVFASSTVSPNWTEVGPASGAGFLPEVAVTSLQIFNSGGLKQLRAATFGRGIWQWNVSSAVSGADYAITISNPSLTSHVNTPTTFNGTLTAFSGYNSAVTLSCGPGNAAAGISPNPPATCTPSPVSVVPTATGTPFTVTVSSGVSQAYSFNIDAVGTDPAATSHSIPVNFSALPQQSFDFTLSVTPSSVSVPAGQSATYTLDVSPNTGTFPSAVTFSCSKPPALTTCSFNPTQVASGSGDSVLTITISTTAAVPAAKVVSALWLCFPCAGMLILWKKPRSKCAAASALALLFIIGAALTNVSCGGGLQGNSSSVGGSGSPGTPAGSYSININVSTTSVTHSTPVNLTVTP